MEIKIKRQRQELGAMAPTRYGLTSPSRTDPGQNVRVRLGFPVSSLLADFHVIVASPSEKEGVNQGRERKLSRSSSRVLRMKAGKHGAWPWGSTLAEISDS